MDAASGQPVARTSVLDRISIKIVGADEETLGQCPLHDLDNIRAIAGLMICTWLYQTALFVIITHRLFAAPGEVRPELVLGSAFIASFILLIDQYMIMRSGFHLSGIEELKRGGIDVSGGPAARIKAGVFLAIRIFLSICIAQLTAVFLSILIFAGDISAKRQHDYLEANAHLVPTATTLVDAEIQRATDAVTAETARNGTLSDQVAAVRQSQIDPSANDPQIKLGEQEIAQLMAQKTKADEAVQSAETFASNELAGIKGAPDTSGHAGDGIRRKAALEEVANARKHAQEIATALSAARARFDGRRKRLSSTGETAKQTVQDKLPAFEDSLTTESSTLAGLKEQLASLTRGRDDAIRSAVENAPDHVDPDNGFIAQIRDLEQIAEGDSRIAAVIILIDVTSFGFELAAVLAKVTSFVPTTYAGLLASRTYMSIVRMVDGMMQELDPGSGKDGIAATIPPLDMPTNDNRQPNGVMPDTSPFGGPDDSPPPPPKRPRGRPRKSAINGDGGG
jgi:hypothetical protein